MTKKIFLFLFAAIFVCSSNTSFAKYAGRKWSFGISGNSGGGIAMKDDDPGPNGDAYGGIGFLGADLHVSYRFSQLYELRLLGGFFKVYGQFTESDIDYIPNAELTSLFHFLKQPKNVDPYGLVGIGFPKAIHAGIGSKFAINDNMSIFTEVLGGTAIIINQFGVRAGIQFYF